MNKSKLRQFERKLKMNVPEMIVVFSNKGRYLISHDGTGIVNKIYNSFEDIKEIYKDRNCIILNVSNIYDVEQEYRENNIRINECRFNPNEQDNYEDEIEKIIENAKKIVSE